MQASSDSFALLSLLSKQNQGSDLILCEIISVLKGCKRDGILKLIVIRELLSRIPYIVLIILFQHYTKNTTEIIQTLNNFIWNLLSSTIYKRKRYSLENFRTLSFFQAVSWSKYSAIQYKYGFPLYINDTGNKVNPDNTNSNNTNSNNTNSDNSNTNNSNVNNSNSNNTNSNSNNSNTNSNSNFSNSYSDGEKCLEVDYMIGIHSNMLEQIENEGALNYNKEINSSCYYLYNKGSYTAQTYNELFPSDNYVKLTNIIRDHVDVEFVTRHFRTLCILINGVPGLGKSLFAEYIASKNIVSHVHRVDLNKLENMNLDPDSLFNNMLDDIFKSIPLVETSVIMIDEIDKWLQEYIERSYFRLKMARLKDNKSPKLRIQSRQEHIHKVKREFLLSLTSIIERNIFSSCIIIFCSNNFSTIFEGLDMTHYISLKSRFMSVEFQPCGRDEIIRFYQYYNERFIRNDKTQRFYQENLDNILSGLSSGVCITYRKLTEISTLLSYDYEKIVLELNENHCGPLIIEEKIIKNVNSLLEELLDDNYLINEIIDYTSDDNNLMEESTVAVTSKNNESEKWCEWCDNEPVKKVYYGVGLCDTCIDDIHNTDKCWICHAENSDYMLANTEYSETTDLKRAFYICEKCLEEARNKYPDHKVHNIVKCDSGCEEVVKLISSDRKKYNLCNYCNYTNDIKYKNFSVDQTDIGDVDCELCKCCGHNKLFYCPEINSNCCEPCSRPYVARKEIAIQLNTKLDKEDILKQEENNTIISLPLPEPELRYNLIIIFCQRCDTLSLDPEPLTCECSDCGQLEDKIDSITILDQRDLTVNLQIWNRCGRCVHQKRGLIIYDVFPELDRNKRPSKTESLNINNYIKIFWSSEKCKNINNIQLIECINTALHPTYRLITGLTWNCNLMISNMALSLIEEKDYITVSQYASLLQKALMLGWKVYDPKRI